MEYYLEYPVRCKTCNNQIACFSSEYAALLTAAYTIQQALDELGFTNYCCRIYMKDPIAVPFNMENREAIEGLKKVEAVEDFGTSQLEDTSNDFSACLQTPAAKETKKGLAPLASRLPAAALGEGINLDEGEDVPFEVPTTIGIPTINKRRSQRLETKSVGAGKLCKILNGRTFLAR